MTLSRCLSAFAAAASVAAFVSGQAQAQTFDERFPASWANVPLPGQDGTPEAVASVEPVPFPRPAPRHGRKGREQVAEQAAEPATAAPEPNRAVLAYAGDDRFSLLWQPEKPAQGGLSGGLLETAETPATEAVPFPRPAPSRIGALSNPVGGDTASRIASQPFAASNGVPGDLAALIAAKAQEHGIPLALAHAVVRVESNYNPRLASKGNLGLMQIKYGTARGLGFTGSVKELFEPATNLEWGMRYLAGAHKLAKGDVCHTILKYAGGHGASHMTHSTSSYCSKVKTYMAAAR